jgi:thiamine-phosphate pyrophosphorylase
VTALHAPLADRERPLIALVTDRRRVSREARTTRAELATLEAWLDEAVGAGVDLILLRERDLDAGELVRLTRAVQARAAGTRTIVLVNDRADVAAAAAAGGVHLRADSVPSARVRQMAPPAQSWIIGRSVHGVGEMEHAPGCDYLLFGTVYESASKPGLAPGDGVARLHAVAESTRLPVLAIGGMAPERVRAVMAAGAAGVAGIGIFLPPGQAEGALGPAGAIAALRAAAVFG